MHYIQFHRLLEHTKCINVQINKFNNIKMIKFMLVNLFVKAKDIFSLPFSEKHLIYVMFNEYVTTYVNCCWLGFFEFSRRQSWVRYNFYGPLAIFHHINLTTLWYSVYKIKCTCFLADNIPNHIMDNMRIILKNDPSRDGEKLTYSYLRTQDKR